MFSLFERGIKLTVSELIEVLQKCDQDKRVFIWCNGWVEISEYDVAETEHDDGYEGKVQIG